MRRTSSERSQNWCLYHFLTASAVWALPQQKAVSFLRTLLPLCPPYVGSITPPDKRPAIQERIWGSPNPPVTYSMGDYLIHHSHQDTFMSDSLQPYGLTDSSVHGILQTRILEWVAIPFSRGSSQPRDRTQTSSVSCIGRQVLYH